MPSSSLNGSCNSDFSRNSHLLLHHERNQAHLNAIPKCLLLFFFNHSRRINKLLPGRSFELASLPDILSNLFWGISADFFLILPFGCLLTQLEQILKTFPSQRWMKTMELLTSRLSLNSSFATWVFSIMRSLQQGGFCMNYGIPNPLAPL